MGEGAGEKAGSSRSSQPSLGARPAEFPSFPSQTGLLAKQPLREVVWQSYRNTMWAQGCLGKIRPQLAGLQEEDAQLDVFIISSNGDPGSD